MAITATDNEELATELWGTDKYWDEDRQQFLPNKVGDDVSVGNKFEALSSETETLDENNQQDPLTNVQTTENLFSQAPTVNFAASSTDGPGTENPSPGK